MTEYLSKPAAQVPAAGGSAATSMAAGLEGAIYHALGNAKTIKAFQDQIVRFLVSWGFDSFSYHLLGLEHERLSPP